jgi:putative toxin-antitoxin system antitoxin component (TIGR02293 family)
MHMATASIQATAARERKKKKTKSAKGDVFEILVHGGKKRALSTGNFEKIYRARPLERVRVIKAGVAPAAVKDIADAMGSPQELVIKKLGIPRSTWARKRSQQTPLEQSASEKVMGLATLIGQVESLVKEQGEPKGFDAAKWLQGWIEQPVPALGGRKPADLLDTREGQQIVSGLLDAIRAGAYL